ncbi:MAG: TauD/TfdA family dioxygenase [Candidatus Velthaea sp.]
MFLPWHRIALVLSSSETFSPRELRRMSVIRTEPVLGPVAWSGRDLAREASWITALSRVHIDELIAAAHAALARGVPVEALTRSDFPLPGCASRLADIAQELESGRGFALVRGLPVDEVAPDVLAAMYWGIGTHLGTAIAQNARGDLLGHVRDEGLTLEDPLARGYQTRAAQSLHVDRSDIVGLLCRRKARSGGLSLVVSSMRIYNEMLARTPWLIGVLYKPFAIDMRGEQQAGEPEVYYRPVFSYHDGVLSCGANYTYIRDGQKKIGQPLSAVETEALDTFYSIAEEHVLTMNLEPGDVQFLNNYVLLHDRTGYDDYDEPDRKRHMVRLWLNVESRRPLAPEFGTYTFARRSAIA